MTKQELFNHILTNVADYRTEFTESEKRRAIQILLFFDEYLIDADAAAKRCDVSDDYDFGEYIINLLDELDGK